MRYEQTNLWSYKLMQTKAIARLVGAKLIQKDDRTFAILTTANDIRVAGKLISAVGFETSDVFTSQEVFESVRGVKPLAAIELTFDMRQRDGKTDLRCVAARAM